MPNLDPRAVNMGFVVDRVELAQFLLEYFGFPLPVLFLECSIFVFVYLPSTLYNLSS